MEQAMVAHGWPRIWDAVRQSWQAWLEAQRRRALARVLAQLDARSLRDIGFEAGQGPLGWQIDEERQRAKLRAVTFRIGIY
jgi:uncharacterized protein YjiS (DUF1127 family)